MQNHPRDIPQPFSHATTIVSHIFKCFFSLTKLSLKGSYSISKGGALCPAPVGSPVAGPLVPPDVRSRADAPLRLVPPELDFPIGSPRIF